MGNSNMAAIYSNGVTAGIFLASILLKEMRYLVYIRYLWLKPGFFDSGFRYPLPLCAINLQLCVTIFLENEVLTKSACAKTWTMDFYLQLKVKTLKSALLLYFVVIYCILRRVLIIILILLEVTIARKMLPHPQGIKGSMHNLLNKGLFI